MACVGGNRSGTRSDQADSGEVPSAWVLMNSSNIGTAAVTFTPAELSELNTARAAIEIRGARPNAVLAFSGGSAEKLIAGGRSHAARAAKTAICYPPVS